MTRQLLKEFKPDGIARARAFLRDAREGNVTTLPEGLLTDPTYTTDIAEACYVEKRNFANRYEAGKYLSEILAPLGIGNINGNLPLWSWLGMFYFDRLVNQDDQGKFKIGRLPDYAFVIDTETDGRDELSNRLMLAWETYRLHGDKYASWMLDQPVMSIPKLVERTIRSRQRFASSDIVKLIGMLYFERQTGTPKPGASNDDAIGGIRRLNDVLDQLYMTYDVYGMRAEQLLALLPEEFKRFNAAAGSARS